LFVFQFLAGLEETRPREEGGQEDKTWLDFPKGQVRLMFFLSCNIFFVKKQFLYSWTGKEVASARAPPR